MDNEVGAVDGAAQNPVMDEASELSIHSHVPGLKEPEGDEVFEEAVEAISDDGSEPLKEGSNGDAATSVSSDVKGLGAFDNSGVDGVLPEQHEDEVMEDAKEEHSSDETDAIGVSVEAVNDKGGTENEVVPVDDDDDDDKDGLKETGAEGSELEAFSENEAKVVPEPSFVEERGMSELKVHGVEEEHIPMVIAQEKLGNADAEANNHNGIDAYHLRTSDVPVVCESMEEVNREIQGDVLAEQNHTHEGSKDCSPGEEKDSGSMDPNDAMPASDAHHQNGVLSVDPVESIEVQDGMSGGGAKQLPDPSLTELKEGSTESKGSANGLSTSFESGIPASKAETSHPCDVSTLSENKECETTFESNLRTNQSKQSGIEVQMESVSNHKTHNSAEVVINGGQGDAAEEENQTSEVSRESETKSANPVLPPVRPAGLGRGAPFLEPTPRVQQPRYNGTVSHVQQPQPVEEVGNEEVEEGDETREKLQMIRVKFLRLSHRLGQTPHNVVVAQVLYRLGLAEQLRGRTGGRTGAFSYDRANAMAEQLEQTGGEPLDFSCTIMVLGKTGVGKSATINSIFDEVKFSTDAFGFGTKKVQAVEGTVQGIKVRVIDTPGLLQSWSDQQKNEKTLLSIKQFMKKTPPDIILYLDRLDMPSRDSGDMALLRTITDVFGPSIWFNAIVVLTHAASAPPEGANGVASTYDMFVTQRSHAVQQAIRQAAGDMRLMNPVSLVENHSACRTNRAGQRVLPNGQVWKPHLLLLSFASKILAEANTLLKLQDAPAAFASRLRAPPLPFLLSSLLQSRTQLKLPNEQFGEDDDDDLDDDLSDSDNESEYDELPPFRPLKKSQLATLTKEQRKAYDAELEYRETLFMKKQLKEEKKRRKFMKKMAEAAKDMPSEIAENVEEEESSSAASVPVPMPDLALPASFDADNPTHRYRYLDTSNQWLIRPVLDAHGWDHDVGYEGINVERLFVARDKIPVSFSGQVSKDKKEASIQMEVASSIKHGEGKGTTLGFDMQSVGKDMAYTMRSETKFCNYKHNKASAGLSCTLLGDAIAAGLKLEDKLVVNNRFRMVVSGGAMTARGDVAYGGSLEATLKDKEYPLGRFLSTLGLSVMDWHGDLAIGGNIQSQIPIGRSSNLIARANLNNRGSGQVSIRVNSSEQIQLALIGLIPLLKKVMTQYSSEKL